MSGPREFLDQLDAVHADATPGAWIADSHEIYQAIPGLPDISGDWIGETCRPIGDPLHETSDADAALIVAAVNALPKLIAALRAALTACDEMENDHSIGITGAYDAAADRVRDAIAGALS